MSPAKQDRHIGIMPPSAASSSSAGSNFWFPINNFLGDVTFTLKFTDGLCIIKYRSKDFEVICKRLADLWPFLNLDFV